ncbi:PP2C family protein-serine/threonine phosphatase [Sphaerisporangium flaviroseum]|uniref:PP2C family protein-serine/threonine phosphatase n=1 Tax=Sphaerisporangium flaviroseum TaxID=509199 RepID=UPI0031F13E45
MPVTMVLWQVGAVVVFLGGDVRVYAGRVPLQRVRSDQRRPWRSGHALVGLPLALMVLITIAELWSPPEVQLSPLLVMAPAITASFGGPRLTGMVGGIAVVDLILLDLRSDSLGTRTMQTQLAALIVVSALLVLFTYIRDRHRMELTRVRSVAEAAQRALLRPLPPQLAGVRLASMYLAAEQEAQIGGDLYAAARTPCGARIVIGDVRGKGLPSVSDAALLLGAFREAARRHAELPDVVLHLDESVSADLEEQAQGCREAGENFITAAVLDIPDDRPVIDMINCGHPPPLLIRDREVMALQVDDPVPPLGLGALADPAYHVETFDFKAGDTLLLYTDGVIEARGPSGAFYPLTERITMWRRDGPETLVEHVRDDLLAYVGGCLGDDAAMVAIQRLPE